MRARYPAPLRSGRLREVFPLRVQTNPDCFLHKENQNVRRETILLFFAYVA